jgi:hypothetical protein
MRRLINLLFAEHIAEQRSTEQLIARFEKLQRLRQIAMDDKNISKVWQCNRLIQATTKELNKRYSIALNN